MGATCSSSSKKKYDDVRNYLNSKDCETFFYAKAFSPVVKDLPYVIIIGENHNESNIKSSKICSTFSGILNKTVSICSDPSSKVTLFLEEDVEEKKEIGRSFKSVIDDVKDTQNPFNITRQKVISNRLEEQYPNGFSVIHSDLFYLSRQQYIWCDGKQKSMCPYFEYATIRSFKNVFGLTDSEMNILIKTEKDMELTDIRLEHFDDQIKKDEEVRTISKFTNLVLLYLKSNKTRLYHENIHDYVNTYLTSLFDEISWDYNLEPKKRKREEEETEKGHGFAMGDVLTFLGDLVNFYMIGKTQGVVIISYGRRHAEHFADLFEESKLYRDDLTIGERSPDHPKVESVRD